VPGESSGVRHQVFNGRSTIAESGAPCRRMKDDVKAKRWALVQQDGMDEINRFLVLQNNPF
jgi:hypothetical protein